VMSHPSRHAWVSLGEFLVCGENQAFAASSVLKMIGSLEWSIDPLFQSILGWVDANHG
jgi:hypothetical protein